jgi:predicted metal-dependent hydrolase
MKKKFTINFPFSKEKLDILVKKNKKSKNIRLYLYNDGQIVINIPWWTPYSAGKLFAESKKDDLLMKIKKANKDAIIPIRSGADYLKFKNRALRLARDRVNYFNSFYNFKYNKISIKNTRSRWGSCSNRGNLNYSYRIIFLPEEYRDYIIVHELCHLGEFNHSKDFWELVQKKIPDYKQIVSKIKNI